MRLLVLTGLATLALGLGGAAGAREAAGARPVDLNTASRAELMQLPGIGEAQARRIAASRPYMSKADLVTRQVVDEATFHRLSARIVVDHRRPAARPKPAPPNR